jgi:histidyl-tRNA synthetase
MTVRGTKNLYGLEADKLFTLGMSLDFAARQAGFQRFIPSVLCEKDLFDGQMGDNRMYEFKDRGNRDIVLLPEITAVARREFRETWKKSLPKPVKIYYNARCYRYDRPQLGRYREFTQFGVEEMPDCGATFPLLKACLDKVDLKYELKEGIERGMSYYKGFGYEVWAQGLQIAGGGPYEEGAGWALGLERLLLVLEKQNG